MKRIFDKEIILTYSLYLFFIIVIIVFDYAFHTYFTEQNIYYSTFICIGILLARISFLSKDTYYKYIEKCSQQEKGSQQEKRSILIKESPYIISLYWLAYSFGFTLDKLVTTGCVKTVIQSVIVVSCIYVIYVICSKYDLANIRIGVDDDDSQDIINELTKNSLKDGKK